MVFVFGCYGTRFLHSLFLFVTVLIYGCYVFLSGCFSTTGSRKVVIVSSCYITCFWLLQWYLFLVDTVCVYGCYSTSY
jgi:hypothetical protein